MKTTSKLKLTKLILKILKIRTELQLKKIIRKNYDLWDSLVHLEIIFLLEKNLSKKYSINKLNKISNGKDLIKLINENFR
jgi:acyl carrier protein